MLSNYCRLGLLFMLVGSEQSLPLFYDVQLQGLDPRVISQSKIEGKERPSILFCLMLVGAVQGASAFL
ncbi:hypothetical protein [Metabacillus fastidiosus]|uniref:hypothetical protein n=1 Tax=Metabacillus fastidiosus TaxID=1458 RepID=UPI003D2D926B